MNLYFFQTFVSLVVHSAMVGLHLSLGWADVMATYWTGHLIIFYEIFDVMLGWEHYWKRDKLMLVHHGVSLAGAMFLLRYLQHGNDEVVGLVTDIFGWFMLSEVTTVFNSVRILSRGCGAWMAIFGRALFAVVFILLRGIQTLGLGFCLWAYRESEYFTVCLFFCTVFSLMNLFWMKEIVRTFKDFVRSRGRSEGTDVAQKFD